MKGKTIKAVLRKKIDEWLSSIEDEGVRKLAEKNTIVTGGCIASMLLREKVNDFDIYFKNHETALDVAKYYVGIFKVKKEKGIERSIGVYDDGERIKIVVKSAGIASENGTEKSYEYFEGSARSEAAGEFVGELMLQDPGEIEETYQETESLSLKVEDASYRPVFVSTNAITLSNKLQIIIRFYGEPDKIHENYDFVHCTCYWTSWDNHLELRADAMESLLSKELRYIGSKYPVCSVIRMRKFIQRQWTINAGQILKMCFQISQLDLTDIKTLEDQLVGVDVAYFIQLIKGLKEKDPEKVNTAYLVEIIDRMF